MKKLALALTFALVGTSAIAQSSMNTRQAPLDSYGTSAPVYQRGSGQQAGGYARELNGSGGVVTVAPGIGAYDTDVTGSIAVVPGVPMDAMSGDEANTRTSPQPGLRAAVPSYQTGSGQQAGGYANELNRF